MIMAILFLYLTSFVAADDAEVERAAAALNKERERVQEHEQEKRSVLGDLYAVNRELKQMNIEKSKIEKNLKNAEENIASLTSLINQIDTKISKQRVRLRDRMKALAKVQGQSIVRVIFASKNSAELDANLKIFKIITEKDMKLLKNYQDNLRVFKAQKSRLDNQEKKYATLKKNLDRQEKVLAKQLDRKNMMLSQIDSKRMLHLAKLKRLKLETLEVAAQDRELKKIQVIEDLLKPQLFEKKGELELPTEGRVSYGYGFFPDENTRTKIRYKGILISGAKNSKVRPVYTGKVAFAKELLGYGKTVIVDHGDSYYTVYSNLSEIEAEVGAAVNESSIIGYTGERESFVGKGLYFELRHFSEPLDPADWLKINDKRAQL